MKLFQRISKAFSEAYHKVKDLFVTPVKSSVKSTELTPTRTTQERFKKPETRPAWVKGLFDDYIYGKVKSLDALNKKIEQTLDQQYQRYCKR